MSHADGSLTYLHVFSEVPQGPIIIPVLWAPCSVHPDLPDLRQTTSRKGLFAHMLHLLQSVRPDHSTLFPIIIVQVQERARYRPEDGPVSRWKSWFPSEDGPGDTSVFERRAESRQGFKRFSWLRRGRTRRSRRCWWLWCRRRLGWGCRVRHEVMICTEERCLSCSNWFNGNLKLCSGSSGTHLKAPTFG